MQGKGLKAHPEVWQSNLVISVSRKYFARLLGGKKKFMQYVVINECYGGFGLSQVAIDVMAKLDAKTQIKEWEELRRDDPSLVKVVRELGAKANGEYAALKIVEVPDGVKWTVFDYDGMEHVAEVHRTWD